MNIARMYTIALGSFGYTEDEARFLYLVAAHSGYFTCQQFLRFIDGKPGKRSLSFVRKLVEQGHASARPYLRNGKVYHVFARNLYEAIGKDNVRFRRKHSTEYIRTRLAALDFILGRLDWKFLESESEKVRLFTGQLGIDKKYLPSKRYAGAVHERHTDRYFVDKFPMYLLPNWDSGPRYLLRDRDGIYGEKFCETAKWMGIHEVLTAPQSEPCARSRCEVQFF